MARQACTVTAELMGSWPCPRRGWKAAVGSCKTAMVQAGFSTKRNSPPQRNAIACSWCQTRGKSSRATLLCLGEMTDSKRAFSFLYPKKVCQRYKYLKTGARLRGFVFPSVFFGKRFIHPPDIMCVCVMEWQFWVAQSNFWHSPWGGGLKGGRRKHDHDPWKLFLSLETETDSGCKCQIEQG